MLTALLLLVASALAADPIHLPVRVHLVDSFDDTIDAAGQVTRGELEQRFAEINRAFAAAGIVWEIESVVVDRPHAEAAFRAATADNTKRRAALRAMRSAPSRLAPEGFDLYVVQRLGPLGIGGAFQCAPGEPEGMGASYVAARTLRGSKLATRKWAHELGYALGLQHTPCTTSASDRLMMSGKCELADKGRVGFTDAEVTQMRAQAAEGRAVTCRRDRARKR